MQAPSSISGRLSWCATHKLSTKSLLSQTRRIVNLEILYIISFKPATICDFVASLSFSLDVFVLVGAVLRSGVPLFQLRERTFTLIEG